MITPVESISEISESIVILSHALYPINRDTGGNLAANIRIYETNHELEGRILLSKLCLILFTSNAHSVT